MLGLDEVTFWRCTLRKLDALLEVHNQIHDTGGAGQQEEEPLTITELLTWG